MKITIDSIELNYEVSGQGDDVLLLHGWGSSLDAFTLIGRNLSARYRVTALDFPGFGKSDMPQSVWCVDDYAAITLKFIEKMGMKSPIMIGHSFGGRVIIKLCGTHRVCPKKIILIDAAGIRHKKSLKTKLKQTAFKTGKWFLSIPLWKKACAGTLERLRAYFGSADYNSAPPVMRQTLVKVVNEDLTGYLKNITASSLLIYGENDTATPVSDAKIMEREIPDAGLCVIKGAGHWALAEKPGEVISIINAFI